jgi:hypothetical protein
MPNFVMRAGATLVFALIMVVAVAGLHRGSGVYPPAEWSVTPPHWVD